MRTTSSELSFSSHSFSRYPNGIYVEGMAEAPTASASTSANADEDDFFSSWDKPEKPATTVTKPAASPAPPVSRTVTSASLRSSSSNGSGAARPARLGLRSLLEVARPLLQVLGSELRSWAVSKPRKPLRRSILNKL